jgi:hypothetical protein
MTTRQELESDVSALGSALRDADASGDEQRASKLAKAYKSAKYRLDIMVSDPGEYDPESPEYAEKYGPLSGSSLAGRIVTGFDKGVSNAGTGLRLVNAIMNPGILSSEQAQEVHGVAPSDIRAMRERDLPLNEGGGLAGQIAGNVLTMLPLASGATTIPRAVGLGMLEGAIQPAESQSERAFNTGVGGASGAGGELIGRGVQRAVTPFTRAHSQRVNDAADLLRREGVDLDIAQRTGSTGAQRVRSAMGDLPMTATTQQEFTDRQLRQYTRAVLRRIGADADEATPEVLREATDRIGKQIDDALESSPPLFDTDLAAAIQRVQGDIPATLTDDAARPLYKNIQDIFNAVDPQTGVISPAQFRQIRSKLSKLKRSTPAAGELAADLEDALLSALERSGGDRAGLSLALAQWRNFRIIEGTLEKGADKFVSPSRLSGSMNTIRNRAVSLRNLGHPETVSLARLAEAGRSLLPETIGNSGTFARQITGQGILGLGAGGTAFATGQDAEQAAMIGIGAATLPMLLQRGMLSQGLLGDYLSGAAPGGLQHLSGSPLTQSLIRQSAISSGILTQ